MANQNKSRIEHRLGFFPPGCRTLKMVSKKGTLKQALYICPLLPRCRSLIALGREVCCELDDHECNPPILNQHASTAQQRKEFDVVT